MPPLLVPHSGVSWATPEASRPPLLPRTPEVLPACFSRLPLEFPLCAGLTPWQPCAPASSAAAERAFPEFPLPAIASLGISPTPLYCVPHAVAVRISRYHPAPPAVVASSSVADPSDSSESAPLHSSLVL